MSHHQLYHHQPEYSQHHPSPDQIEELDSQPVVPLNPLSSTEDASWSVVSTPPSSTLCVTTSGSQLSPRAIAIEELNEENDDEVIIATNVDEQTDFAKINDGLTQSVGTTSATSNPYSTSFLFRQRLLVNRASTIKSLSRFSEDSARPSSPSDKPKDLPFGDPALRLSVSDVNHHRQVSDQVSVVSRSEALSVTDTGTFKRDDQLKRLQISEFSQSSPSSVQQTSSTATQFVSAYSHLSSSTAPFSSSHLPTPSTPNNPCYFSTPVMQPQVTRQRPTLSATGLVGPPVVNSTSLIPAFHKQEPSPLTSSYSAGAPSLLHREPAIAQFGSRGGAYDSVAPNQRDYAVASAAYTKAMGDAARIQMMTAAQFAARTPHQPIIIQNTTKAVAESQNESKTTTTLPPKRSAFEHWTEFIHNFWGSKLNRFLLIGLTGAGLYLYWEWCQHYRRMQLMQRRIEANPLLRLGQIISGVADGQRSRTYNSGSSYY